MKDPDGVYLKLLEIDDGAELNGTANSASPTHIRAMPYIGINVSDFEESLAFYQSLGYSEFVSLPQEGSLA